MNSGRKQKRTFTYHRSSPALKAFIAGITGMVLAEGAAALFFVLYFVHNTAVKAVGGAGLGLLFAYVFVSMLTLFLARHEVSDKGVVVRQGSRFKAFIPRENILGAEISTDKLSGMPAEVRYVLESGLVQVTAGESGLVVITLVKPQPVKLAFYRRPVQAQAFLVNADEPDEFAAAINEQARAVTTDAESN